MNDSKENTIATQVDNSKDLNRAKKHLEAHFEQQKHEQNELYHNQKAEESNNLSDKFQHKLEELKEHTKKSLAAGKKGYYAE